MSESVTGANGGRMPAGEPTAPSPAGLPPLPVRPLHYVQQQALPPTRYRSLVMALSLAVLSCPVVPWALWWFVVLPIYPAPYEVVIGWVICGSVVGMCAAATAAGHLRGRWFVTAAWSAFVACFVWMGVVAIYVDRIRDR